MAGIISRIPYLGKLGVDAVWLSPFCPSALAGGGYDADNYRDVDPRIGTLEQLRMILDKLHEANIRVIIDVIPHRFSDRHVFFQKALKAGPGSAARERYIFRDVKGPDCTEPPTDWNWDHPDVHEEFLETLRF